MPTIDMSCAPCCQQSSGSSASSEAECCGFTCETAPAEIQVGITVNSGNEACDNLFASATLSLAGDCETSGLQWTGTISNGVAGTLRCNNGQWEFRSECDPLNWHPVTIISCNPFHATCTANLTAFFGGC